MLPERFKGDADTARRCLCKAIPSGTEVRIFHIDIIRLANAQADALGDVQRANVARCLVKSSP
jgi:hypothetical protein